jgi:hypothetical protein
MKHEPDISNSGQRATMNYKQRRVEFNNDEGMKWHEGIVNRRNDLQLVFKQLREWGLLLNRSVPAPQFLCAFKHSDLLHFPDKFKSAGMSFETF